MIRRPVAPSPGRRALRLSHFDLATWRLGDLATVPIAAAIAVLSSSCAYYNGMYNARHFARQAETSERLGRASEAAERWRLAEIHAESVVTRHPRSRWVDDAMLIRARALIHLEAWGDAAIAADQALRIARNDE